MSMQTALLDDDVRPLRRDEYDRLVELGVFEGEKLELLYGRIVRMAPQGEDHSGSIDALTTLLFRALDGRARVRVQMPFRAGEDSEPEPDIAVVSWRSPFSGHPSDALLVIEVAASSQERDRGPKGALYALAGVPEYWLVDVVHRRVERYLRPVDGRYAESSLHGPGESLAPRAFPDVVVELTSVLPPERSRT